VARIARICPLYFATLFFLLALDLYSWVAHRIPSANFDFSRLVANLSMISGLASDPGAACVNPPAWSISVEMVLYIALFPLLCLLNRKIGSRLNVLLGLGILATVGLVLCYTGPQCLRIPTSLFCQARGVFGFTAGFLCCSIWRIWRLENRTLKLMNLILSAGAIMAIWEIIPKYLLSAIFPLLVFSTVNSAGRISHILRSRLLDYFGERSYSIYLWHFPMIIFFNRLFLFGHKLDGHYPPQLAGKAVLLIIFFTLLIAELSFRYFECPAREWMRQKLDGQRINKPKLATL
jgi:peptidoglycan/LPS O-acetylase OafA/YrhL